MSPTVGAAPMEAAMAGTAAAATVRAAKVFWLRLPNGRPRLRDTGGVTAGLVTFFPLPFGRPGLRLSGAPSPLAPGLPREDMVGLRSNRRSEAEEVMECAVDPERPRHLKRNDVGERADVIGSAMPNALVTAPSSSNRAHPRELTVAATVADRGGNRRDVTLTHARRHPMMSQEVITMAAKSKRWDVTLRHSSQSQRGFRPLSGSSSEGPGAGKRLRSSPTSDRSWSRHVPRRPTALHETWP
jgi:hypothetical protein